MPKYKINPFSGKLDRVDDPSQDLDGNSIIDFAEALNDGVGNEVSASDAKDAVSKKHNQNTDTTLQYIGAILPTEYLGYEGQDLNVQGSTERYGHNFIADRTGNVTSIKLWVSKTGTPPADFQVDVYAVNESGHSTGSSMGYGTYAKESIVAPNGAEIEINSFSGTISLVEGIKYALIFKQVEYAGDGSNYFTVYGGTRTYINGTTIYSLDSGSSWNDNNTNLYFIVTLTGEGATIGDFINDGVLKADLLVDAGKKIGTKTIEAYQDSVDKKHDKLHNIDNITNHNGVGGAVENNLVSFNSNGLPKDSGYKDTEIDVAKNIVITLCGNAQNYIFTKNTYYTVFNEFCFCGTTVVGSPTNIKIIAHSKSATAGIVRIYDVTNSKVICEKTGIVNLTSEVIDLGTLSNLPTGEAVCEIQAKTGAGGEIRISSLAVKF